MRPNVILIIFDTARADAFEPYGAPRGSTPAVADLARRGTAMPSMYAPACWTLPSHASFFTGLLPRATGLMQAPGGPPACRALVETQRHRLLPEALRRAGYETRAASANMWISQKSGFATGFDSFVEVDTGRQAQIHQESRKARAKWALEGIRARVDDGAGEVGNVLRGWIREAPPQPFFWFVNLIECHSPYLPPKPYNRLGPIQRWRAAEEARRYLTLGEIWRACAGGLEVPTEALERMRSLYAASVRALDDWLAAVLEELDRSGLLEDTLVILTSDHGENLGENGLMGHAFSLDDRLLHVPFVSAGPGTFTSERAQSLVALPRLLAEALALEDHPWQTDAAPDAIAVAEFDPPAGPDHPRWHKALADWGLLDTDALWRVTSPITAATDGHWKLVRHGDRELIYDLDNDPMELAPVHADGLGQEIETLRGAIDREPPAVPAPIPHSQEASEEISEDERRRLEDRMRLLGYL